MRRPCVGVTVRRGYAAEAIGGLICSPRRGCVANTARLKSEQGAAPFGAILSCDSPN